MHALDSGCFKQNVVTQSVDLCINMMFNFRVKSLNHDSRLIRDLGGPSKVAELLGLPAKGGPQRVQNWMTRGIPAAIKLKFPHWFMPELFQSTAYKEPANITHRD
jgi:hypothetical protein